MFDGQSLLAIFAHPDDESLACGGLLAICADEGMRVLLVCATHGEDGPDRSPDPSSEPLPARRVRELGLAADVLGIDTVMMLDFEDGMLPWADGDGLEETIGAILVERRPDAVVTFDEDGLYWHPDHVAVHHAVTNAVSALGTDGPMLYYVSVPEGCMRRVMTAVRHRLEPGDNATILGVTDVDAFGASAPEPTIVLDVEKGAARKLAALRCHATQTANGPFTLLTDAEAVAFLGVEHLRRAQVGNRGAGLLERLPHRT